MNIDCLGNAKVSQDFELRRPPPQTPRQSHRSDKAATEAIKEQKKCAGVSASINSANHRRVAP